jgi:hypothetical protein
MSETNINIEWIYVDGKIFIFNQIFIFLSLRIWQLLYLFLSHFGFRFFVKGVLLWCLVGVFMD